MNFISTILHAGIGYPIRRSVWPNGRVLVMRRQDTDHHTLYWAHNADGSPVCLLGSNHGYHLTKEDITANDWEAI